MIDQATRNILTETLGVVERREDGSLDAKILEESEFAKKVPDYDQPGAEGLFTTLLTYGLPAAKSAKAGKTVAGAVNIGPKSKKLMGGIGALWGLLRKRFFQQKRSGLSFPRPFEKHTSASQEQLNDLALLFDGLVLNGTIDGLLGFCSLAAGKVGDLARGAGGLISHLLSVMKQNAAVIGIFNGIDPDLATLDKFHSQRE